MNTTTETCITELNEFKTGLYAINKKIGSHLLCDQTDWDEASTRSLFSNYTGGINQYRQVVKDIIALETTQTKTQIQTIENTSIPESWKTGIKHFALEVLDVTLHKHQIELCESTARNNVLIAGRGAGKSLAAQVKAIHKAVTNPGHTVLVVSSGQRMSSDFGSKLLDLIRESTVSDWVKSIAEDKVTFHNGSTIYLLPANPDTIRGYHPKRSRTQSGITVILDEACFMEQGAEIRKAVEYALITQSGDNGQMFIVSSPTTTGSWVHEYVESAKDPVSNTRVFHCASSANPNISDEEIERLRATKNEVEFRAEVLGEWVDGAYGLFAGLIELNRTDENGLPPQAITAIGADLALSFQTTHDSNALVVAAKWTPDNAEDELEARYRIIEVIHLPHASDRELRAQIKRVADKYGVEFAAVEQFQGKALAEWCQESGIETELIAATSNQQRMIFHEMHRLLRQNLLELPNTLPSVFIDEMNNFEYRMEKNGSISFGHPASSNAHDDTVYAAAWAIHTLAFNPNVLNYQPPTRTPYLIQFIPKTPP